MNSSPLRPAPGVSHLSSSAGLMTVRQVADYLAVSERQIRRWITTGMMAVHRLGRAVRISQPDLALFLARHRSGGL